MRQTVIRNRPEGMALFVVMMLLLVMSIAGVAMLRTAILEERMAAVSFDRALALQAAEIALREGEGQFNAGTTAAGSVPDWSDAQSIKPALTVNGIVTNSYYLARMMRSNKPEDVAVVSKVGVVFPNQDSWGTHMNIAGGAVARYAKNPANAIKFLEYLASPQAQNYFANGNNEWPAAKGVTLDNPALKAMTDGKPFKSETIPISAVGANMTKVQQMLDRVGFP